MNDKFEIIKGGKSIFENSEKSSAELGVVNPDGSIETRETELKSESRHPAGRLGHEAIQDTIKKIESVPGYSDDTKKPNLKVVEPLITEIPKFD